jgi:hypothetical protein
MTIGEFTQRTATSNYRVFDKKNNYRVVIRENSV